MDYNKKNIRKRPDRPLPTNPTNATNPVYSCSSSSLMAAKESKIRDAGGMDELLADLGYEVRSSDMADVAQKLEQLEMVMGSAHQEDSGLLSLLSTESVHYNPSDLSSWLESMLSEINPPEFSSSTITTTATTLDFPNFPKSTQIGQIYDEPSSSNYDLSAIPGEIVYGERVKKKAKHEEEEEEEEEEHFVVPDSCSSSTNCSIVVVDSQETGVRLVHTLIACSQAIQQDNLAVAEALMSQIGPLAGSQSGAMKKVAIYFADALASRIYKLKTGTSTSTSTSSSTNHLSFSQIFHHNFYRSCPYLQFAHFTANQAILEAFQAKSKVHIIDFGIRQGTQWPQLIQALALREGGPPTIRLTGIARPDSGNPADSDPLREIGWKLAGFADNLRVGFEFQGVVVQSLADLDSEALRLREGESVAVNSVFELHELLASPGSVEKVLGLVREVRPTVVTVVEQEANHNGPVFADRFNEALHYYSTVFDSLESCGGGSDGQDLLMSEMYLGSQIYNVVACEGADRVERHETTAQWKTRFLSAGFAPVHLGSSGFKQVSGLVSLFGNGDGYRVEENNGCLTLGWYTRPLIATSAWQLTSNKKP
ncbi:hypothetical protein Sjap_014714 [Stephania japonica]|uniref:DELLA protein n=1 Tax=Stephania japonica TaxID=461633 RepID=A0AAP0II43_9MAGN